MMPFGLPRDSWHLLGYLADLAVRALAFAAATAAGLAVLRVSRATHRLFAWTVVLYAALVMPLLCWVTPTLRWSLPNLVGAHNLPIIEATALRDAGQSVRNASVAAPPRTATAPSLVTHFPGAPDPSLLVYVHTASHPFYEQIVRFGHWGAIVLTIYVIGLLLLLFRAGLGWIIANRLKRVALPIEDIDILERLRFRARASGSKRIPELVETEAIPVPITLSALRPVILLPANWRQWTEEKLEAVLVHEMAHVARGDAFTQQLSLLYRAWFWFSPLSWWLHRHIGELAEQASDEAALDAGADQTKYAETLLGFFAEVHAEVPTSPRRVRWQALAMARGSGAERRVEHILAWKNNMPIRLTWFAVVGTALFAVPLVLLAASLHPTVADARPSTSPSIASLPSATSVLLTATAVHPADAPGEIRVNRELDPDSTARIQPTPARTRGELCGTPILVRCLPMDAKQLAWLSKYGGRPTFEVTSDSRFHSLVQAATPDAIFHLGYDMPLSQAIESMLNGPSFAVELRDGLPKDAAGRYLMISAQRSARGIGQSFYWFDLRQGVTFGGIFFNPTNGEPTPTLTIFSNQIGDPVTNPSQLPAAFLRDLESWQMARNIPHMTVRYFINASGRKSVLMHDREVCIPATGSVAGDPSECQAMNEAASESDLQASLYLLRIHYAEGSPARTKLEAAQSEWEESELSGCESKPDRLGCRTQLMRARAQELTDVYLGFHL